MPEKNSGKPAPAIAAREKGQIDSVPPMPAERWRAYLEDRFVEAITEHDETSEA